MLRAAETIVKTDVGRQRRSNEDSSYASAHVFVVADGMGGAQAGEVASQMVVEAFTEGLPPDGSPEERLSVVVQRANQEIHSRSRSDAASAGMGTTVTAAYLDEDAVVLAHVGDSRGYLLRDGELSRLTEDHSLVEELLRGGKLTEEEALEHPQRSVITRALGIEPIVEIDTWTYPLHAGDVLLLCSDGLTSMISEQQIQQVMVEAPDLAQAGDRLIAEANEAGGRDNITVVLFRVELATEAEPELDQPTIIAPAGSIPVVEEPAKAEIAPRPIRHARLQGWKQHVPAGFVQPAPKQRHFGFLGKTVAGLTALLVVLCLIGGGGYLASRQLYFLGTNRQGTVVVYRGFPYSALGIPLYETFYVSGVPASTIPLDRRSAWLNHAMRDQSNAISMINALELGQISNESQKLELFGLIPAALLVSAGFAAIYIQRSNQLSTVSLVYGGLFFGLCVAAHIFIRVTLPYADPFIFPLVAVLACFGVVMVYRINGSMMARQQAQWFVLGLVLFAGTVLWFRDYRKLENYRYLIMIGSLVLLALPHVPHFGEQVNGAYLAVHLPGITFQPTEFGKVGLVIFLASYLRDHRQSLASGRRILGYAIPPLKHLGPLLVLWGAAMLVLILLHDIGSSLMFYGALLAILYVATDRASFVLVGVLAFAGGAWYLGTHIPHVDARVQDWLHTYNKTVYNADGGSLQVANGTFAMAAGGLFGQGFGQTVITDPGSTAAFIPVANTDMIYSVITGDLGLFGAAGLLCTYLMFVGRGFKTAMLARDSFSKLLAVGLSSVIALQVFVIAGGVTRVIPLTGVPLPFVSYGGSSILANFVLVALLLLISDRARRPLSAL